MSTQKLLSEAKLGSLKLANHMVMAPMTRSRATADHLPTAIMADYYGQRASAGLIVTEGIAPSADGAGYARIPGLYNKAQVDGWKPVTAAVHEKGGKIFAQLMHSGRIGHEANLEAGARLIGPSAIAAAGQMWTDTQGMQDHPVPHALTSAEIEAVIQEFVLAARNAVAAGFDGVELHGANGYLLEQFLRPSSNQRTDEYGGSTEGYIRFAVEVVRLTADAIGKEKVGIRLSPWGVFNDQPYKAEYDEIYEALTEALAGTGIAYIHLVDHASMGAPAVERKIVDGIRRIWKGTLILSGGYDAERAEQALASGEADLVAFGRPFLANPDLPARFAAGAELNPIDYDTFYTPGEKGYTDYPTLAAVSA